MILKLVTDLQLKQQASINLNLPRISLQVPWNSLAILLGLICLAILKISSIVMFPLCLTEIQERLILQEEHVNVTGLFLHRERV